MQIYLHDFQNLSVIFIMELIILMDIEEELQQTLVFQFMICNKNIMDLVDERILLVM